MQRVALSLVLLLATFSSAQNVQVSRTNKTIAVTAEETATADPDLAVVTMGYHNYGMSHQDAYDENISAGQRLLKALTGAGIEKQQIETGTLKVERTEPDEKWTLEMRKQRQFEATQTWKIRVSASAAQNVIDLAMHSGANTLENVDWSVSDPSALQAKASGLALAKARAIAEQMAKGLGAKLGELVYASNQSEASALWNYARRGMLQTPTARSVGGGGQKPALDLFPQQVKQRATVYAVFAIE